MSGDIMSEANDSKISWDFKLNFDVPVVKAAPSAPRPPKIIPRELLKVKFPRIFAKVELLWGTIDLHKYFEETLYTDRSNRQGFPQEVMQALGELNNEHRRLLVSRKMISEDVWDMQFRR